MLIIALVAMFMAVGLTIALKHQATALKHSQRR
jgi:hypothetical protein